MSILEIIQTSVIAISVISLFIATGRWIIDWPQRLNEKKTQMAATVLNIFLVSYSNRLRNRLRIKVIQLRDIRRSTAIMQEAKLTEHTATVDRLIGDESKHLICHCFQLE